MNFMTFLNTPSAILPLLLGCGVVFVNGWTDAPNSICSVVTEDVFPLSKACVFSSAFNFLGAFLSLFIFSGVSESIFELATFKSNHDTSIGICATLLTVIIFSIIAWLFGMPSSESHAMVSALIGASIFLGSSGFDAGIFSILLYMFISCGLSFLISYIVGLTIKGSDKGFKAHLIVTCGLSSFLHGAQDGQKFIGVLLFLALNSATPPSFFVSLQLSILVCIFMSLGTLLGGGRIIKSLGENTIRLNQKSAFASDIGAIISTLLFSIFGLPVSTGTIKATSIMGGGISFGERVNKKTAIELFIVSIATFPVCIILSGALSLFFKSIFP